MLKFTKMHGCGNDMIMIDNLAGGIKLFPQQIKKLCSRRFGIGADGLILVEKGKKGDCFMNYFNSDGTIVEVCGNGVRCTAAFFEQISGKSKESLMIETRGGTKKVIYDEYQYTVNMGLPVFDSDDFPNSPFSLEGMKMVCVSMGNPHAVAFVDNVNSFELETVGPKVESADIFPNRINFEIVEKVGENHLNMRVWERGCGMTLACGTGACAVYVVARNLGVVNQKAVLTLPGGDLVISENEAGEILMAGDVEQVFEGEVVL